MQHFVKIYTTILDSSVWAESKDVRLLWFTMLVMAADNAGRVEASVGGLARRAGLTREECDAALLVLTSPDRDDQSGVDEGRRVRKIERGWEIVNHSTYRDFRTEAQTAAAERVQRHRGRARPVTDVTPCNVTSQDVTLGNAPLRAVRTDRERELELERDQERENFESGGSAGPKPQTELLPPASAGAPKRATRVQRWRRVPADWQPKPEHVSLAFQLGVPLDDEAAKFRDHEYRDPKSDADACFRTWLRNSLTMRRQAIAHRKQGEGDRGADQLSKQQARIKAFEELERLERDTQTMKALA